MSLTNQAYGTRRACFDRQKCVSQTDSLSSSEDIVVVLGTDFAAGPGVLPKSTSLLGPSKRRTCQTMPVQLNYRVLLSTPADRFLPPGFVTPRRGQTMLFSPFEDEARFLRAWQAVEIARPAQQGLFTFDVSDLPYILVCGARKPGAMVSVTKGEVRVSRPLIITPENMAPEFQDFFEEREELDVVQFLLARTAAFSNLKIRNTAGEKTFVSDSVEEVVEKLNKQLDDQEEDRVAILTAPAKLGGVALLKYTTDRVLSSAPDNVQELRERGFLP